MADESSRSDTGGEQVGRRLSVLCLTTHLGGGGAEMHLVRLATSLPDCGVSTRIAVMRRGGEYEALVPAGVPVDCVGGRSKLGTVRNIGRLVRRTPVDVIFTCLDQPSILTLLGTRLVRRPPPVVVSIQIPPSWNYKDLPPLRRRAILGFMRLLYPSAATLVAISQGVAKDIRAAVPRAKRVEVIYNAGFDEQVERAEGDHGDNGAAEAGLIVACGRLAPQKSYPTLLDAFALVRKHEPARLRILGEGEERAALGARAKELGIQDSVEFPGFVANPWQHMRRATVFVLSSSFEGFGNVIVEAMACGTPVVSTDAPYGPAEIIRDGVDGLLVPVGDVQGLSDAVLSLLRDPELRTRLTTAGRERARHFSAANSARQHADLFRRIAAPAVATP